MPTISPSDIDATWPDGVLVTSTFDAWRKKTNGFIEAYNTGSLVPDGSITPVKLSTGGPAWTSAGVLTVADQLKSKSLAVGSTYGQFTVSEAGVVVAFNTITGTSLNTAGAVSANSLAIGTSNNKFTVSSSGTVVATSSVTATSLNVGSGAVTAGAITATSLNATGAIVGASLNVDSGAVTAGAITAISLNATGAIAGASLSAGSGTISTTGTISGSVVTSTGVVNANTLAIGSTNTQFTVSAAGAIVGTSLNVGSGAITTTGNVIAATPTLSTHLATKEYVDNADNSPVTADKLSGAQTGAAPIYGARAWAKLNPYVGSIRNGAWKIGTYSRSVTGTTVNITNHGLKINDKIRLDFTSGGASSNDGLYTVTSSANANQFVVNHTGTTTTGNVTAEFIKIQASGNISTASWYDNSDARIVLNFAIPMPNEDYATMVTGQLYPNAWWTEGNEDTLGNTQLNTIYQAHIAISHANRFCNAVIFG